MTRLRIYLGPDLGDCAYFAHALPLYVRRGFDISVACADEVRILFRASGVELTQDDGDAATVAWERTANANDALGHPYWQCNSVARNLARPPMPDIGMTRELWEELCSIRLDVRPFIADEDWRQVTRFLDPLPKPIILLQTGGRSTQLSTSLSPDLACAVYRELLDRMDGTLVILDWDDPVPALPNWRVRSLTHDWRRTTVSELVALIHCADLLIGIDSGPLQLARYTHTPAVGIFHGGDDSPVRCALPRARQIALVPKLQSRNCNHRGRIAYNIVERDGDVVSAECIGKAAARVLGGPRYLPASQLGADVQLQQFVLDWEKGFPGCLSSYVNRDQSFDRLLRELRRRFEAPRVVETGCIRCDEDWRGAGYSTYLFGAFLERHGGHLTSVDNDPAHCAFARRATAELSSVTVACDESKQFLSCHSEPIDLLFLDSLDTTEPGHSEHCLAELQASMHSLRETSLVGIDDTVYAAGSFRGKGALAVPWLLGRGWRILFSGYQTICTR